MKNIKPFLLIGIVSLLFYAYSASAASFMWMGGDLGGDGFSWSDPLNWSTNSADPGPVPASEDYALIRGDTGGTWPVVQTGVSANPFGIWCGFADTPGVPEVTVNTNGTLSLTSFSVGFVADGRLIVNGGAVTVGSWGLHVGTGNEWGYGNGTINIFSGSIEAQILFFGTYTNSIHAGGAGTINLFGGTISADSITQLDTPGCLVNIESGELILDGGVRTQIDSWVAGGYMTAYNGSGTVERIYNAAYPNKTVVSAINNSSGCNSPKWWDHFPRIVQSSYLQTALYHNAKIGFNGAQQDPGWALYGQKITEVPSRTENFHNAGLKSIGYFETFGDSYCFIAELDNPSQSPDYNSIHCHHWNWQNYSGGEIVWVGMKNFWDNESFAQPWTRTHPVYGGPMMTYPDGSTATGYFGGDVTDPRKNRSYDASTSKNILGDMSVVYYYSTTTNGALYIPAEDKWATLVLFHKDSACPLFSDFAFASTHYAADMGLDGMWSDNFGPWDSFGNYPVQTAFGDWSVARFRNFLSNNFSSSELSTMGVTNVSAFDIRDKLIDIAKGFGWPSPYTDLSHPAWDNSNWQNEDIWQAYIIYKRQTATEALTKYYNAVHDAAKEAGKDDFLLQGNGMPIFNLGWAGGRREII